VAISTPSATAAVAATNEIPIVFAAVEDSAVTGLLTERHTNVTGLSHGMPLIEHLELVKEIIPEAKIIGVLYGPVSESADNVLHGLNAIAPQYGFEIVAMPVHDENELVNAVQGMIGSTDAVLLLGENDAAATALDKVIRIAGKAELPVFATNADLVAGGAVASVTLDFYDLGWQAGEMVLRILQGESPTGIESHRAKASNLIVNPSAAETMGIGLPPSVIARAGIIIR
jgi:putative ABC transport system substrate-binding protein